MEKDVRSLSNHHPVILDVALQPEETEKIEYLPQRRIGRYASSLALVAVLAYIALAFAREQIEWLAVGIVLGVVVAIMRGSGTPVLRRIIAVAFFSVACGPVISNAQVPATLRIAVVPDYPPLEFKDPATSKLKGFDIDLGKALAKKLGVRINWQETSFDQMVAALQTNRVDMILSAMTDLPVRREHVTFVDYMKSGPQFYVQRSRAAEFPTLLALCGKRVGANRRSSWPNDVSAWSDANCIKANKPGIVVVGTDGSADAGMQLRQGRLDVAVQGGETLAYVNSINNDAYQLLAEPFKWRYNGIGIAPENSTLIKAISGALNQMIADGSYAALLTRWGLQSFAIQNVLVNSQK